jgi:hypothetical protein
MLSSNTNIRSVSYLNIPTRESKEKQFLIVPVIFRHQIEAIAKVHYPQESFGFFYGTQNSNYRIIKKIWPIKRSGTGTPFSTLDLQTAFQLSEECNLSLLGCFHTGPLSMFLKPGELRRYINKPFSDIRISLDEQGNFLCWQSSQLIPPHLGSKPESIVL